MKELSIKEKAKRYDEATERAKYYYDEGKTLEYASDITSYIFPELKESEDERIRKEIIATIHLYYGEPLEDEAKEMIAWIENKGKQKPIDKIQIGKKYKCIASPRYSTFMKGEIYKPEDKFLCSLMNFCSDCFEPIEDDEQRPTFEMKTPEESLGIDSDTYNKIVDECVYGEQISANETPYPETLEKAINLYYYSYGNGKGEFEHLSLEKFRDIVHTFVSDYGQKPAWSEEDEKLVKNLISTLSNLYARNLIEKETKEKYTNLLKSIKDRYTWKPSDEQMKALKWITDGDNPENWSITLENLYQDLKKLREK